MGAELGTLITADLAQIKTSASDLGAPVAAALNDGVDSSNADGFADHMRNALQGVNQQDHDAAEQMAAVDSGQSDDLVGAMLSSQQAGLSFSMLMQVRNKVMGAMEDLVKLPL